MWTMPVGQQKLASGYHIHVYKVQTHTYTHTDLHIYTHIYIPTYLHMDTYLHM